MKVLLLVDVSKLGYLGDVVEVSSGHARNYLIPQGLAIEPTEANLRSIAEEKQRRAQQRIKDRSRLEEACTKVNGAEAVLAAKANEQGVLFGSVTAGQIAANLRAQGFEVADDVVQLAEHIKHVGTHSVELKFTEDLKAKVSVVVVAEGVEAEKAEPAEVKVEAGEEVKLAEEKGKAEEAKPVEQKAEPAKQKKEAEKKETAEQRKELESKPKSKKRKGWFGRKKKE